MNLDDVLGIVFVGLTRMLMDSIWFPSLNNDMVLLALREWIDVRSVESGVVVNLRSAALTVGQALFIYHKQYLQMNDPVIIFGVVFLVGGWALGQWAAFSLGKHASVNIGVTKDQRLVMDGPYATMLHPQWTGEFLAATGIYLIFVDSLWVNILLGILNVAIYVAKTRQEQALLAQHIPGYYEYTLSRFTV